MGIFIAKGVGMESGNWKREIGEKRTVEVWVGSKKQIPSFARNDIVFLDCGKKLSSGAFGQISGKDERASGGKVLRRCRGGFFVLWRGREEGLGIWRRFGAFG